MKRTLILITGLVALCSFTACQTPEQMIAGGVYAAGVAAANDNMRHDPKLEPVIQDVAAKLPHLFDGTLAIGDRGKLQVEIDRLIANNDLLKKIFPGDSPKLDDAKAFLAGTLDYVASLNGGNSPTLSTFIASAAPTQFAKGLSAGVEYYKGKQSATVSQ